MQFLTASLETLASQLSDTDLCNLSRVYPDPLKRKIVSEKGVYCYDYMDSMKKFDETKLSAQDKFYNKLKDYHITEKEYKRVKTYGKHSIVKRCVITMITIYYPMYCF